MTNIIFMKFIDSPLIILLDPKWSIWQLPHSLYDVSIYLFDLIYIYIYISWLYILSRPKKRKGKAKSESAKQEKADSSSKRLVYMN